MKKFIIYVKIIIIEGGKYMKKLISVCVIIIIICIMLLGVIFLQKQNTKGVSSEYANEERKTQTVNLVEDLDLDEKNEKILANIIKNYDENLELEVVEKIILNVEDVLNRKTEIEFIDFRL